MPHVNDVMTDVKTKLLVRYMISLSTNEYKCYIFGFKKSSITKECSRESKRLSLIDRIVFLPN